MGIFKRCQITLEFDSTVNFRFKTALKKKIVDNDRIVSFIVTKKVTASLILAQLLSSVQSSLMRIISVKELTV